MNFFSPLPTVLRIPLTALLSSDPLLLRHVRTDSIMRLPLILGLLIVVAAVAWEAWNGYQQNLHAASVVIPSIADLRQTYGAEQNLTHEQTRQLYLRIIKEQKIIRGDEKMPASMTVAAWEQSQAMTCNLLRWRIRLYCRSRDHDGGAFVGKFLLPLRDAFWHALNKHSIAALMDIPACLMSSENRPCPSYGALRARKSSKQILDSCWKTSSVFDRWADTEE